MSKLNRAWHDANPMPENPTIDQRVEWHLAHTAHCGCRPIPRLVLEEMARRGIAAPETSR
ncbi:hypothetical protein OSH10_04305 [Kaistia defluvii]|jgi:hypothetical protein|uniref:hypothetical protein n=1 Tax=Kaistia defluvii TaxID=410841 RepID=UPI00224E6ADF|nr:hypothetical protein [Kaistia defluvii]MCX5517648.1 hypothetical protein [Kaistia defluvii]